MAYPRISRYQYFTIIWISSICLTPFGFPTLLFKIFYQNTWYAIVAAFVVALWNTWVAVKLCGFYPRENIAEWSRRLIGKAPALIYTLLVVLVMFLWGVLMFHELWLVVTYTQLRETPVYFPAAVLIAAVIYVLTRGLEGWARFSEISSYLVIGGLVLINVPQIQNTDFGYLLPFTFHPDAWGRIEFVAALFILRGIFLIYFVYPYIKQRTRLFWWSTAAVFIAFMEVLVSVLLPVAVFGTGPFLEFTYPYQESLSTVHLDQLPLKKIAFVAPVVWQLIFVYVLGSSLFCSMKGLKSVFGFRNENRIYYGLGAAAFGLSLIPLNQSLLTQIILYWSLAGLFVLAVAPTVLLMVHVGKRRAGP